jgi:putative membrane protein
MNGFKLFFQDWKHILKNKRATIGIGILLLMPLLYAGMFIASYWNPYGQLDQLPVAVVNLDKGAQMDGKSLHIGDDLVGNLKKNKALDFHFIDSDQADKGLEKGRYYMTVTIPTDFSKKVTTLMNNQPKTAKLLYKTNQGNNYVAGQIGSSAVKEVKDEVGAEITKSYTKTVFANFGKLAEGVTKASEGATKLHEGTLKAQTGSVSLHNGLDRLSEGTTKLTEGISPLLQGEKKLKEGVNQLQTGTSSLSSGLGKLYSAQQQLENGSNALIAGSDQLSTGMDSEAKTILHEVKTAQSMTDQLALYAKAHPEAAQDPSFQSIVANAGELNKTAQMTNGIHAKTTEGAKTIQSGELKLNSGLQQFGSKLSEASTGSQTLSNGANQLSLGMNEWSAGFSKFGDGVTSASAGVSKLQVGSGDLTKGLGELATGSGDLANGLEEASKKSAAIHSNEKMLTMFSRPVQLVESTVHPVKNYGAAMTPYFLTLGVFVGGLLAANIIPFSRAARAGITGFNHFTNKLLLYLSIAVLQVIIVDLVILYGFKIDVLSVPKFVFLSLLASFIFVTLIYMLVSLFGPLGRFAAIFFLVTQLATSGGTFPIQLSPPFIQKLGTYMPMKYAVNGFRAVLSTKNWTLYWHDVFVLIGFIVSFVVIAFVIIVLSNRVKGEQEVVES